MNATTGIRMKNPAHPGGFIKYEIIEPLEHDLDRPVGTSNQAMVWHSLTKLGIKDRVPGYGRLMAATGNG